MILVDYLRKYGLTRKQFADRMNVTPGLISQIISGTTGITAERAVAIETATDGEVARHELRPDLFSAAPHKITNLMEVKESAL